MTSAPTPRKIIHIDMDAFFAAVEQRDNESYRGKPVIVGGSPEQRGVVSTASYEARKFGVHSAMATAIAIKLCPQAILLPPRFKIYKHISQHIMGILRRYTPQVEVMGLDEAYLDVTAYARGSRYAREIAKNILTDIYKETALTASAGVAPNKFLAKIASDYRKPHGLTVISPERVASFLADLPVKKLPGVGRSTEKKMALHNIYTITDLRKHSQEKLQALFGKYGQIFYDMARGEDQREVITSREIKSIGCEETFPKDIISTHEILSHLREISLELERRIAKKCTGAKTVTLKVTYSDFRKITRSITQRERVSKSADLFNISRKLLEKTEAGKVPIRLLGISVSGLDPDESQQLLLPF